MIYDSASLDILATLTLSMIFSYIMKAALTFSFKIEVRVQKLGRRWNLRGCDFSLKVTTNPIYFWGTW
jgi:hypothetical protein